MSTSKVLSVSKISLVLLLSFLFINSCKTDFNIIAPYKETTVVYGLLDPDSAIQYIKINKAFLGEGNALLMAQQFDSTNYPPGSLNVSLQRLLYGTWQATIQLDTTTAIAKDPGLFSNPYQVLYKTAPQDAGFLLQDGNPYTYNLVIYNKNDQKTLSSSTSAVSILTDNQIYHPSFVELINFTGSVSLDYQVDFQAVTNGRLYSLLIKLHYTEINTSNGDTTKQILNWDQGTKKSVHLDGTEQIIFEFQRTEFYNFVATQIKPDPNIQRYLDASPLEFLITYAGDDLSTYLDVNQPSIGIIQEKPEFSNITNGIGVFSSRSSRSLLRRMDQPSIDSLSEGQLTGNLNFH